MDHPYALFRVDPRADRVQAEKIPLTDQSLVPDRPRLRGPFVFNASNERISHKKMEYRLELHFTIGTR